MPAGTIRVQGKAKIRKRPDTTVVNINISEQNMDYGQSVLQCESKTGRIKSVLEALNIAGLTVRTGGFDVKPQHSFDRRGKSVFEGYLTCHNLRIVFPFKKESLGGVFDCIAGAGEGASFTLEFTVADTKSVRRELLNNAVLESRANAEILAAAAGVCLGNIMDIQYGWSEMRISNHTGKFGLYESGAMFSRVTSIDPDDVSAGETVNVVWEILNNDV